MASRVPQPHVIGNFKPSKTTRAKAKRAHKTAYERREGNSKEHLEALRKCPCVITLKVPAGEVHHLKQGTGERGMGMRSTDKHGLPLSREPHDDVERVGAKNETAWFKKHGIDEPLDLAAALYAASPDVSKMTKIIIAHHRKFDGDIVWTNP